MLIAILHSICHQKREELASTTAPSTETRVVSVAARELPSEENPALLAERFAKGNWRLSHVQSYGRQLAEMYTDSLSRPVNEAEDPEASQEDRQRLLVSCGFPVDSSLHSHEMLSSCAFSCFLKSKQGQLLLEGVATSKERRRFFRFFNKYQKNLRVISSLSYLDCHPDFYHRFKILFKRNLRKKISRSKRGELTLLPLGWKGFSVGEMEMTGHIFHVIVKKRKSGMCSVYTTNSIFNRNRRPRSLFGKPVKIRFFLRRYFKTIDLLVARVFQDKVDRLLLKTKDLSCQESENLVVSRVLRGFSRVLFLETEDVFCNFSSFTVDDCSVLSLKVLYIAFFALFKKSKRDKHVLYKDVGVFNKYVLQL